MDTAELFAAIVKSIVRPTLYHGLYRYRVQSQIGDKLTLQIVESVDGLPDEPSLPVAHGIGGASEVLSPSTIVLVGFQGGSPSSPFVAHVITGGPLPVSVAIDANTHITLGGFGAVALARANQVDAYLEALRFAIAQLGGSVPPFLSTATTKVKGE